RAAAAALASPSSTEDASAPSWRTTTARLMRSRSRTPAADSSARTRSWSHTRCRRITARPGCAGSASSLVAFRKGQPRKSSARATPPRLADRRRRPAPPPARGPPPRAGAHPPPRPPLEVRRDQVVLRAVVGVERRLRRPCLGKDPLDAGRAEPLLVEELAGRT